MLNKESMQNSDRDTTRVFVVFNILFITKSMFDYSLNLHEIKGVEFHFLHDIKADDSLYKKLSLKFTFSILGHHQKAVPKNTCNCRGGLYVHPLARKGECAL